MRRLEFLRRQKRLSMRKLKELSGVNEAYICKAERWGDHLGAGQLRKLADALEWSGDPDALLDVVREVEAAPANVEKR